MAEARDRVCRARRRLLHPWDFQRRWFRELAQFYRHLSREEFWLRYHEGRKDARLLAALGPEVWDKTDYFVLRQAYYHRDRCFHLASALLPRGGTWLEYGCGVAPVSAWLARHRRDARGVIADVPGRTWDFAKWRLWGRLVRTRTLPHTFPFPVYQLVICSEVFEHTPNPVEVATLLCGALAPGGHLLVNFVETPSKGANLAAAQEGRARVLEGLAGTLETVRPVMPHGPDGIYRKPA